MSMIGGTSSKKYKVLIITFCIMVFAAVKTNYTESSPKSQRGNPLIRRWLNNVPTQHWANEI